MMLIMNLRRLVTRGMAVAALSTIALTGVSVDNADAATKWGKPWKYDTLGYFSSYSACKSEMFNQTNGRKQTFQPTSDCYQLGDGRWVFNYRHR